LHALTHNPLFLISPISHKKQKYESFEIGFNFLNAPARHHHGLDGKEAAIEEYRVQNGKHTAQLFLFAMEKSGTGPPMGLMTLTDDKGAAAFLRAVEYHMSFKNKFGENIERYVSTLPKELKGRLGKNLNHASEKEWNEEVIMSMEDDDGTQICKASINPLLIFLHVDQGCFEGPEEGYTPFASPVANSRCIYQKQVKKIINAIEEENSAASLTGEDYAIIPFDVGQDKGDFVSGSLEYMCTLNRDKQSGVTIVGKKAVASRRQTLDTLYEKVCCKVQLSSFGFYNKTTFKLMNSSCLFTDFAIRNQDKQIK